MSCGHHTACNTTPIHFSNEGNPQEDLVAFERLDAGDETFVVTANYSRLSRFLRVSVSPLNRPLNIVESRTAHSSINLIASFIVPMAGGGLTMRAVEIGCELQ